MNTLLTAIVCCLIPFAALAQTPAPSPPTNGNNTPVIIVDQGNQLGVQPAPENARPVPGRGFANFPENAVTRVGENTTGQHVDTPQPGEAPAAPLAPSAQNAPTPASPTPPASPVAKLWPRDTTKIFMYPCVGTHEEFIAPCACVITHLMAAMPHDEFLRESDAGTIEKDERLIRIRTDCATSPQQKQQ